MPTKQEILEDVKKTAEKVDGYLSLSKYREKGSYGNKIFHHFDYWSEIKEELGMEIKSIRKNKMKKQELVKELIKEGASREQILEKANISKSHLYNLFRGFDVERNKKVSVSQGKTVFNVSVEKLKEAGIPVEDDIDLHYYVETDEENNRIILEITESEYRLGEE